MQSCLGVRTSSEFNQDKNVESYGDGKVFPRMRLMLKLSAIFVFWHKSFVLRCRMLSGIHFHAKEGRYIHLDECQLRTDDLSLDHLIKSIIREVDRNLTECGLSMVYPFSSLRLMVAEAGRVAGEKVNFFHSKHV